MIDDDDDPLVRLQGALDVLDQHEATLVQLAANESLPSDVRLAATMGQLYIHGERRRLVPTIFEIWIHLAYGGVPSPTATPPTPAERHEAISALVKYGMATRSQLETLPMETIIVRTRERLAKQGFADDTGQAG